MTVIIAAAGRLTGSSESVVSGAPLEPRLSSSGGGYLGPAAVVKTVAGLARHQVDAGDAAPTPAAQDTPAPAPAATPAPTPVPQPFFTYTIQPGDTVSSIATNFGISENSILWNNPDLSADPNSLLIGANLLIPSVNGIVYHVMRGDTLSDIAAQYGVDVQSIAGYAPNGISSADSVSEGMVLLVPGAVPPPPAPPPAVVRSAPSGQDTGGTSVAAPAAAPLPATSTRFIWPFHGPISSPFGEPRGGGYHKGIDIDGFNNIGAAIVAAAGGTVVLAAWDNYGLGNHIVIDHGDGTQTVYGHLSAFDVSAGETVAQGQLIGALGCTGYCTGPHLHFEVHIGGVPVDPLPYLP